MGPLGPTAVESRSLAPDLARGYALLLIALANAHVYLFGQQLGVRRYPVTGTAADRSVTLLQMVLVDGRAYPMFAALFGYSMVQLVSRQTGAGLDEKALRRLIVRRGLCLGLFGFLHALLLYSGDIIGAYGLLAVVLAGMFVRARDGTLLLVAGLWVGPLLLFGALQGLPAPDAPLVSSISTPDPLTAMGLRLEEWFEGTFRQVVFTLVPAVLLGAWAARRRMLDEPGRYRTWLWAGAFLGMGVAVVGGLPMALMAAGVWTEQGLVAYVLAGMLHTVTGYAGGIGYAAIAALVALRSHERRGPLLKVLIACGQRSMTCYLGQSLVFTAVLAACSGGLGDDIGVASAAALAVLTWSLTVLVAEGLRRLGWRGPVESLARRLTYGLRIRR